MAVKVAMFFALNAFLTDCQKRLVRASIRVHSKKPGKSNWLKGSFTEIGLNGVLEEANFDSVDVVFFFLGAIVDEYCGLELFVDVTEVCKKYVHLVNHI